MARNRTESEERGVLDINGLLDKIGREIDESRDKIAPYEYRDVTMKLREGDLLTIYKALQAMLVLADALDAARDVLGKTI